MSTYSQSIDLIVTESWFALLSFLIAIIGVIMAIFFYYRSKKVKSLCYAIHSINVVKDLGSEIVSLKVLYNGKPVNNLTVTRIAFWNAGRATINSKDIPTTKPLIVSIEGGGKILDAKIYKVTDKANLLSISTSDDQLSSNIKFEYLDKGDGAIFQFIHNNINDKNMVVDGIIIGAGSPIKRYVHNFTFSLIEDDPREKINRKIIALMIFGLPLLPIIDSIQNPQQGDVFGIGALIVMFWGLGYYIFKRRMPKGFEVRF
ncbi:MAG: hypothetical protein GQ533_02125 [Methanosarcinaceae archaeon]|nr:hypothetical protein [Methanosarcinaceae archaeon]